MSAAVGCGETVDADCLSTLLNPPVWSEDVARDWGRIVADSWMCGLWGRCCGGLGVDGWEVVARPPPLIACSVPETKTTAGRLNAADSRRLTGICTM